MYAYNLQTNIPILILLSQVVVVCYITLSNNHWSSTALSSDKETAKGSFSPFQQQTVSISTFEISRGLMGVSKSQNFQFLWYEPLICKVTSDSLNSRMVKDHWTCQFSV